MRPDFYAVLNAAVEKITYFRRKHKTREEEGFIETTNLD